MAAKLKELNPGFDGKVTHKVENDLVTDLQFFTDNVTDISRTAKDSAAISKKYLEERLGLTV